MRNPSSPPWYSGAVIDRDAEADADAVAQVLAGDREAFSLLVARYARRVHDLARRMLRDATEAEDVSQHAFMNAFRALPRFDPRRPFRHWLLRITSNLCRNRLAERRRRPVAFGLADDQDDGEPRTIDPPARAGDGSGVAGTGAGGADPIDTASVRAALEALPDRYRLAAVLRYAHGLSLDEIAEITDEPEATVKTHLHRARAALARLLAPDLAPDLATDPAPHLRDETARAADGTKG